jgi:hypothetical protein
MTPSQPQMFGSPSTSSWSSVIAASPQFFRCSNAMYAGRQDKEVPARGDAEQKGIESNCNLPNSLKEFRALVADALPGTPD